MDIKILFSDLDGTLVEHAGDVTENAIKSTEVLRDNGTDLVLVSGRHPDIMKSIYSKLMLNTPVIGCNGGIIKDINTNRVLFINELPKETVGKVIEIATENSVDWVVYEKNNIFYYNMPPKSYKLPYINSSLPQHLKANFTKLEKVEDIFSEERIFIKVLLLFDNNPDSMNKVRELLENIEGVDISRSAQHYLDVMTKGTSKGNAIKRYIDMVGVEKENIASIGDAQNDLDMIEYAGLGIAMGNAVDSVKDVAQYITASFPEGFNEAVEYIIKDRK